MPLHMFYFICALSAQVCNIAKAVPQELVLIDLTFLSFAGRSDGWPAYALLGLPSLCSRF